MGSLRQASGSQAFAPAGGAKISRQKSHSRLKNSKPLVCWTCIALVESSQQEAEKGKSLPQKGRRYIPLFSAKKTGFVLGGVILITKFMGFLGGFLGRNLFFI